MMGFGRLFEIAGRRPWLVTAVGAGLAAEAGRVLWTMWNASDVLVIGHGGFARWSVTEDHVALVAYATWVAICALLLIGAALRSLARKHLERRETGTDDRETPTPLIVRTRPAVEKKRA